MRGTQRRRSLLAATLALGWCFACASGEPEEIELEMPSFFGDSFR